MDHVTAVKRLYGLISDHDIDAFGELLAVDFIEHETIPGVAPTREGAKDFFRMQIAAFPDLAIAIEDIIDGGDQVVARVRLTGTQQGDFMGVPASGTPVSMQIIDIMRFGDDGLVHEHWGVADQLGMMAQLGAVPA